MLKMLDSYTLKEFGSTFFLSIITIIMVVITIDFSERIDDFLEVDAPFNEVVFDHYSNWIPSVNVMIWSLCIMILGIILVKLFGHKAQ